MINQVLIRRLLEDKIMTSKTTTTGEGGDPIVTELEPGTLRDYGGSDEHGDLYEAFEFANTDGAIFQVKISYVGQLGE